MSGECGGVVGLDDECVGASLDLVWDGGDVLGGAGDVVSVVLLNGDRMEMRFLRGVALRGDGGVSVAVPMGWNGEGVHCYVLVSRGRDWSESCYVGVVNQSLVPASVTITFAVRSTGEKLIGSVAWLIGHFPMVAKPRRALRKALVLKLSWNSPSL